MIWRSEQSGALRHGPGWVGTLLGCAMILPLALLSSCSRAFPGLRNPEVPESDSPVCAEQTGAFAEEIRWAAVNRDPQLTPGLLRVLTASTHEGRWSEAVGSSESSRRAQANVVAAAIALGERRDRVAIPALSALALDAGAPTAVRVACTEALGLIGGPETSALLEQLAVDGERSVRQRAIAALEARGVANTKNEYQ